MPWLEEQTLHFGLLDTGIENVMVLDHLFPEGKVGFEGGSTSGQEGSDVIVVQG
jgi:hypothetical protein